jgi:hypothetical protein
LVMRVFHSLINNHQSARDRFDPTAQRRDLSM